MCARLLRNSFNVTYTVLILPHKHVDLMGVWVSNWYTTTTTTETKLQEFDIMEFIQLIVYAFSVKNITVLGSRQVFDENIL